MGAVAPVLLGPLNEKYRGYTDINAREVFCQAPLLILCVLLGVFPWLLLDWMDVSVVQLVTMLRPA